jgi:hypothetical protein
VRAVRRGDDVAVLERAAHADGARLLPDRDVEEARQLAGAEALLDLLLEAADEEHLAQDVAELGLRESRLVLCRSHAPECTVPAVPLADRWNAIERGLDPSWTDVSLSLTIKDDQARSRAAALLGPAGPGIGARDIRFGVSTQGAGIGPEAARRLLRRIDAERIVGRLELVEILGVRPEEEPSAVSLAAEWQAALEALPSDWSDVVAELELDSSADIDRAAVLCAPTNPMQSTSKPGFRFRCASRRGYGASAGMVGRCLSRLDEAGITGRVRITRTLSDVHPVGTQGATFVVGRRPS